MDKDWRKRYQQKWWKAENVGDKIEGVFTEIRQKELGGELKDVPVIETEEGEKELPPKILYQLAHLTDEELEGKTLKVECVKKNINKFGKDVCQYKVEIV